MNKSKFLTFVLSFIPGCGLMYLGYMRKGLQVMLTFAAATFLGGFSLNYRFGGIEVLFLILLPIIWFYQFFDTMHSIRRMREMGISQPTDDGFFIPEQLSRFSPSRNHKSSMILAVVLICFGGISLFMMLLDNLLPHFFNSQQVVEFIYAIRVNTVPALLSLILIIVGIRLLRGGKSRSRGERAARRAISGEISSDNREASNQ